ncbi:hypothetical protein [Anabaena sp. CS-542/02]|uniref:hypothetical protein n=1 Tax=Anabaena sp. CS-542/02 TaxID=3021719 RepID=UPI00232FC057|nr:hypothetical protein [Anabaena sp. CS-542/02]MDB9444798.1 hypothetical protein [Anabaena sp. CS-542/02]
MKYQRYGFKKINKGINKGKKQKLYEIALNVILFLYIYIPSFSFFVPATTVILPLGIIGFSFLFHKKDFVLGLKNKTLFLFSMAYGVIIAYSFIFDFFGNSIAYMGIGQLYSIISLRVYLETFLGSVAIYLMFKSLSRNAPEDLIKSLFLITFVQFIFCLLMLTSGEIRDYISLSLLRPDEKIALDGELTSLAQRRGYGLASGHLFSYPLFNGLVCCSALWFFLKKRNVYYLILSFMAVVPILINARIGLISMPVFLISLILEKRLVVNFVKWLLKNCAFVFMVLLIGLSSIQLYNFIPEKTLLWVEEAIFGIIDAITYGNIEYSSTLNDLLTSHIHIPDNLISFLIGDGMYLFLNPTSPISSDVGYVRLIFFGGLILSVFLYIIFIFLFGIAVNKAKTNIVRLTLVCGSLMIFIANFKGLVFHNHNSILRAMVLLCVFVILDFTNKSVKPILPKIGRE